MPWTKQVRDQRPMAVEHKYGGLPCASEPVPFLFLSSHHVSLSISSMHLQFLVCFIFQEKGISEAESWKDAVSSQLNEIARENSMLRLV